MTRNALITGVGRRRGIGAGIAAGLAVDGWDLALSFWSPYDHRLGLEWQPDDPDLLAAELRSLGRRIELLPADLEEPAAPDALVHRAAEQLGPLDALVCCRIARASTQASSTLPWKASTVITR